MTAAGGMPDVWHSYNCTPCRATLAIGGAWKAAVNCPNCQLPMQRLAEHRTEATP